MIRWGLLLAAGLGLCSLARGQTSQVSPGNVFQATTLAGGATCRVPYWSAAGSISSSAAFCWDGVNSYLGIGGTPSYPLHVYGSVTLGTSSVTPYVYVNPNLTSIGTGSVFSGIWSNLTVNDTTDRSAETTHAIADLSVTTVAAGVRLTTFAKENRLNVIGANATNGVTHTGSLDLINAFDPASGGDANTYVGHEIRGFKNTLSDGAGSTLNTGTLYGLKITSFSGGGNGTFGYNFPIYVTAGTYSINTTYHGIGAGWSNVNPPLLPVDINHYDGTSFGVMRIGAVSDTNHSMILWRRSSLDAYLGYVGAATAFCNSALAGDFCWRMQQTGSFLFTTDNTGARTDLYLKTGGAIGLGTASVGGNNKVLVNGHLSSMQTTAPTCTGCGNLPVTIVGSDNAVRITMGTGSITAATVSFNAAYTNVPVCIPYAENNGAFAGINLNPIITATAVQFNTTIPPSTKINMICLGQFQ